MAFGKIKVDTIISTSEELTLPTSVGTDGQVLTTDGNGVLSFEDNATGTDLTATADGTSLTVESSSGNNVQLPAATTSAWGVMSDEDKAKLDLIEGSATADQTDAEIRTAVGAATDSNVFTDADHTKLDGVAVSANNYAISADLLDEDDFATDSATKAASQQSIKAYVDIEVAGLINSAPSSLDTLNELAAALGDDSNYAATITTSLGLKAPIASPAFTGDATLTGDLTINTDALFVDASAKKVMVGTTTEGEANADDLTIATSGHTGMTIRSGTANRGNIYFSDGTSGDSEYRGYITYDHDGNKLSLATNNGTRMLIDSTGSVLIGPSGATTITAAGVATFAGSIAGSILSSDAQVYANVDGTRSGTDSIFFGYDENAAQVFKVDANGAATFAGNLTAANLSTSSGIWVNNDNIYIGNGFLRLTRDAAVSNSIITLNTPTTMTGYFNIAGSGFLTSLSIGAGTWDKCTISDAGNITTDGNIVSGTWDTGNDYSVLLPGEIRAYKDATTTSRVWEGGYGSTTTSWIRATGAATFSSDLAVGSDPNWGSTSDSGIAAYVSAPTKWFGIKNAASASETNNAFQVTYGATNTAVIHTNGDAMFAGSVKIGGTAAANEIEEYEEGTWSPTLASNSYLNSGTWAASGSYTRIGNIVTVHMAQAGGNISWAAPAWLIGGLPFPAVNPFGPVGSACDAGPSFSSSVMIWTASNIYIASAGNSITSLRITITYRVA